MRRLLYLWTVLGMSAILVAAYAAHAQSPMLLEGKLVTEDGRPVANQPIVIEWQKESKKTTWQQWFDRLTKKHPPDESRVISITDWQGAFHVINLPAGDYTLKVVRPGTEPIPVKTFTLPAGYVKTGIKGAVTAEQLGREGS